MQIIKLTGTGLLALMLTALASGNPAPAQQIDGCRPTPAAADHGTTERRRHCGDDAARCAAAHA